MASWKNNKVVGIIAGTLLVISLVSMILYAAKTKSKQQEMLLKKNPPAVIE